MTRKTLIAGGASLTLLAGLPLIATAQDGPDGPPRGERIMEELDTNGDGQIAKSEVEAKRASAFAEADANGDGAVSQSEFSAFTEAKREEKRAEREAAMFSRLDTDGDGVVSDAEFNTREMKMFERVDADGDGVISEEEMEEMRGKARRGMGRGFNRRGGE